MVAISYLPIYSPGIRPLSSERRDSRTPGVGSTLTHAHQCTADRASALIIRGASALFSSNAFSVLCSLLLPNRLISFVQQAGAPTWIHAGGGDGGGGGSPSLTRTRFSLRRRRRSRRASGRVLRQDLVEHVTAAFYDMPPRCIRIRIRISLNRVPILQQVRSQSQFKFVANAHISLFKISILLLVFAWVNRSGVFTCLFNNFYSSAHHCTWPSAIGCRDIRKLTSSLARGQYCNVYQWLC